MLVDSRTGEQRAAYLTKQGLLQQYTVKVLKKEELEIIKEINSICNKLSINEDNKQLLLLQSSIDNIYISKAKGAYISFRVKWIEEEERNSAYFCRLEEKRQEQNVIKTLLIESVFKVYSKLFVLLFIPRC